MWFKKTPLPPIELRFNLPPNGTYPPRILIPEKSIWLKGDVPIKLTRQVAMKQDRNKWLLYRTDERAKVLVNGQEFFGEHMLQDSDYIRIGKLRGIFQADPVADFRADVEKETQPTTITSTERLKKWLVMDAQGISVDGGQHKVKWDQVVCIEYGYDPEQIFKWWIKLLVLDQHGKTKKLPTKLNRINQNEFWAALFWILHTKPFGLNVNQTNLYGEFDAYSLAAYQKLIFPNENNVHLLPESPEKMLGLPTKWNSIKWVIGPGSFMLIVLFIASKPTGLNQESLERFISIVLIFVGVMIVVGIITFLAGSSLGIILYGSIRFFKQITRHLRKLDDSHEVH